MLDYTFDAGFRHNGNENICGVDEAGRGPLAGPVVAAACILAPDTIIPGLDDSKKLTEKKRESLFTIITEQALFWGIGQASPEEIDEYNILNASLLAMRRAIDAMGTAPDHLLIDGNQTKGFTLPCTAVVHGDAISQSIAAASVLAKVTRDRMCEGLDTEYPQYGFASHKGYPTKAHKLAVYRYGPAPCHRRSFLRFLEKDKEKLELWLREEREKEKAIQL